MRRMIFCILFVVFANHLFAQKIKVTEGNEHIGGGNNNALEVIIYQSAPDVIEKEVKSLMKDYDAKVTSQDGGWFGDNAKIKKMGNNTVDIYAKWEKVNDGETKLVMAFDLGGAFISSSKFGSEYKVAKDIVNDFATKATAEAMKELVKTEQKSFDKMTDEQKKLEKENKNLNDDIANYKQKIEDYNSKIKKAQEDIEANKKNQGVKQQEITAQQKVLSATREKQKNLD